jgi:hypothetical protein
MKERILTGWTFVRALYLVMGILILAQSIVMNEWLGIVIGGYFSAMGLFGFGCAGGYCAREQSVPDNDQRSGMGTAGVKDSFDNIK